MNPDSAEEKQNSAPVPKANPSGQTTAKPATTEWTPARITRRRRRSTSKPWEVKTENLLTVIDIGSAKTCVIVAEVNEYALRYRGHGIADSRGMRKGVIADLDKAVDSIKKAVEEAENVAQAPVEHAIVGVAGSHIRGVNSHGGITLGGRSREISRDDVRAAVEKARTIPLPEDREPLHLLPQEFIRRRPARSARSCRTDGQESRSARPRGHRRHHGDAERSHGGEPRRHSR